MFLEHFQLFSLNCSENIAFLLFLCSMIIFLCTNVSSGPSPHSMYNKAGLRLIISAMCVLQRRIFIG